MIEPGLCGRCRHAKVVRSDRDARFLLCLRSRTDPRYPRYPRLPVRACRGFEESDAGEAADPGQAADASDPPAESPVRGSRSGRGAPDAVEGGRA